MERGVIFFNTAEVYGPFTNEEAVGEARATWGGFFGLLTGKRLVEDSLYKQGWAP